MKSNIKFANVLVVALAIAYFIIGIINLRGLINGKVILLCSIVSIGVSIVQILDVIISALQIFEAEVMKASISFLYAWGLENENKSHIEKTSKFKEYEKDQNNIHKKYMNITKIISLVANVILISVLIIFILGLSTEFIKENTKLADTLSLLSFALIFASLTVQEHLNKYIMQINTELKNTFDTMEEEKNG